MSLNKIDFSDGIKSSELNENFEIIQNQINRERKSVGGSGIASGLDIESIVDNNSFSIRISEASIISATGEEIHVKETIINLELPKLTKEIEYLTCNSSNEITLKHIPYSLSRKGTIETLNHITPNTSGVSIKYIDSIAEDDYIRIRNINRNVLALSGVTKRDVVVTYQYTNKRIDTLYIDNNNEFKIISSLTSPSPTAVIPSEYKYLVAFIEVDGMYLEKDGSRHANIKVIKDLRSFRNIYTDSKNNLWLCGTRFEDLQIIHFIEPKSPTLNSMWYDNTSNQLKVWKSVDKIVYMDEYEITTDYNSNPNIFKDYSTNMYYSVGKNELEVYINNVQLGKDEFAELISGTPVDILNITNEKSNTFRVYSDLNIGDKLSFKIKSEDSHEMWVPINHSSFIKAKEIKLFSSDSEPGGDNYFASERAMSLGKDINNYPHKYQYFLFDRIKDINMLFTPNMNELSVMINQTYLHSDQFEELTVYDLFQETIPEDVVNTAREHFGWDNLSLEQINEEYDNVSIGFRTISPLDVDINEEDNGATDLYVEAIVERRINDAPLKRKLQRTASFAKEDTVEATNELDIVLADCYYRYGEYQLEVFAEGIKLLKDIDYIEGTDLSAENITDDNGIVTELAKRRRGAVSRQFSLLRSFEGRNITYRVTTNVYSYDHINEMLNELDFDIRSVSETFSSLYEKIEETNENVESSLNSIEEQLETIQNLAGNIDDIYIKKDSTISESQMPPSVIETSITSLDHINKAITYASGTNSYSIKDECRAEDFILVIKRDILNSTDKMLIRDVDYDVYNTDNENSGYQDTIFRINDNLINSLSTGDIFILSGVKIGKKGR